MVESVMRRYGGELRKGRKSVSIREFAIREIPVWYKTGHFLAKTPESYGKKSRMTIRSKIFHPVSTNTENIQQFFVDTGDFRRRYGCSAHIVRRRGFFHRGCAAPVARVSSSSWSCRPTTMHRYKFVAVTKQLSLRQQICIASDVIMLIKLQTHPNHSHHFQTI